MRLRWLFTVQTAVILLKNTFGFMFNRARSTVYNRAGGSARGKAFDIIFSNVYVTVFHVAKW